MPLSVVVGSSQRWLHTEVRGSQIVVWIDHTSLPPGFHSIGITARLKL